MKSKLLAKNEGGRTFALVLDPGEEAFKAISEFAGTENVTAAAIMAIGAFERAIVGWFDFGSKSYRKIPVSEQCEVLSAIGDIAAGEDGKPSLHLHAVLGRLLGGIAMEEAIEGRTKRNDRLLAVPLLRHQDRPPYELSEIPSAELKDIEDFFVAYQAADGKDARIVARLEKSEAESVVSKAARP
mgnify:CR=1 FL=1